MKNTKLWIADPDLAYVQAFAEYVNLKKGLCLHGSDTDGTDTGWRRDRDPADNSKMV